jgi:hypothetical protein
MGMNARQRLEEKYDLARHMQVLQALYQQLGGDNMKTKVTVLGTRGIPMFRAASKPTARICTRKSIVRATRRSA